MAKAKTTTTARKTPVRKKKTTSTKTAKPKNGDTDVESLSTAAQDAFCLSEAAILLDQARGANGKRRNKKKLATALENELEVWTAIRTAVLRWTDQQQEVTKQNLCRLSDFIAGTIMNSGVDVSDATIDTLININFQIAEGLLEGQTRLSVEAEAYRLWEADGRPDGRDQEHWFRAQEKVQSKS